MRIDDIEMTLSLLPERVLHTLTHVIYSRFPRASAVDRQHAKILFNAGLIEHAELGIAPGKEGGAHKILVPTLAAQNCMIKMGLITPGEAR